MNTEDRLNLFVRQKPVHGKAVVGFDIGTKNMAATRIVRCNKTNRRIMTHAAIINLQDPDGSQTVDVICNNIVPTLLAPELEWIWYPQEGSTEWKHYITIERQMDHINRNATEIDENGNEVKAKYRPPIMYGIYCMIRMIAAAISGLFGFMSTPMWGVLIAAGVDPNQFVGRSTLEIVPRAGGQKLGLKGIHGDNRKYGSALDIGIAYMDQEGDDEGATWMETLDRVKPLQDANDAYLQAAHFMDELEEEERKKATRDLREVTRHEKAAAAEAKKAVSKKRKRIIESEDEEDEDDDEIQVNVNAISLGLDSIDEIEECSSSTTEPLATFASKPKAVFANIQRPARRKATQKPAKKTTKPLAKSKKTSSGPPAKKRARK